MEETISDSPDISTKARHKILKWLSAIIALTAMTGWIYQSVMLGLELLETTQLSLLESFQQVVSYTSYLFLLLIAFILIFNAKPSKGTLFMSLFLGMYSLNTILAMMLNPSNSIHFFLGVLSAAYTGVVFIKTMQCFPRQLLSKDILKEGKENMLHRYFVLLLGRLNLWGFMAVACLILFILVTYIPLLNPLVNLLILGTAFGYLFLSYRKADKKDRSKILWIFWGLLMFIILFIGVTIYRLFYGTGNPNIHIAVSLLSRLILIFSFLMSVFFADTFDAKLVIQRTAINGVLFLIVVLIYNTLENYIVHFIARALHIQDVLLSSFFAGLFALSISPIHSKLTHIVKSYLKKNSEEEAKSDRE